MMMLDDGEDHGLEVVFKYAHHSSMLGDLSGLQALREVCNDLGIARYSESPSQARGWSPSTPTHTLVSPAHVIDGPNYTTKEAEQPTVDTDLSALASALGETDIPIRNISRDGSRPQQPRKPPTPDVLAGRKELKPPSPSEVFPSPPIEAESPMSPGEGMPPMPPARRDTLPSTTLRQAAAAAGPSSSIPSAPDEYEYHRGSSEGAALQMVFTLAMRDQAREKLVAARRLPNAIAALDTVQPMTPLFGLQMLHSVCVEKKAAEPHKLVRFQSKKWDNSLTKYQREKMVLHMSSSRYRSSSIGALLLFNESTLGASGSPLAPVPPLGATAVNTAGETEQQEGEEGKKKPVKPKRLSTAKRIARKTSQLQGEIDHVKSTIASRLAQHKQQMHQSQLLLSGTSSRTARLKEFLSTLPRGSSPSGGGSKGGTSTSLPRLAKSETASSQRTIGTGGMPPASSDSKAATARSGGGASGAVPRLPSIRQPRTAGDGNNLAAGTRLLGASSHASELLRQLGEKHETFPDGANAQRSEPTTMVEPVGAVSNMKPVQHRFMTVPQPPPSRNPYGGSRARGGHMVI